MKNSVKPMKVMFNLRLLVCEMVAAPRQAAGILTITCLLLFVSLERVYAETALDLSTLPEQEIRILVIGDSLSSGYGLQGSGWVELANSALVEAGKRVTLVNDSISGDTTAGGVARISSSIDRTQPDWVMIELGGNDGLRGLPPKIMEKNLMRMVEIAERAGTKAMLLGIRIPPNYGRNYTEKFEQVFVNVSNNSDSPLLPFFIGKVGGDPALNQADMIHPNDKAQPIIRDLVLAFLVSVLE